MMIFMVAVEVAVILYADIRRTITTENCQEQAMREINIF